MGECYASLHELPQKLTVFFLLMENADCSFYSFLLLCFPLFVICSPGAIYPRHSHESSSLVVNRILSSVCSLLNCSCLNNHCSSPLILYIHSHLSPLYCISSNAPSVFTSPFSPEDFHLIFFLLCHCDLYDIVL